MTKKERLEAIQMADDILKCMERGNSVRDWYADEPDRLCSPSRDMEYTLDNLLWATVEDEMREYRPKRFDDAEKEMRHVLGMMRKLKKHLERVGCDREVESAALGDLDRAIIGLRVDLNDDLVEGWGNDGN